MSDVERDAVAEVTRRREQLQQYRAGEFRGTLAEYRVCLADKLSCLRGELARGPAPAPCGSPLEAFAFDPAGSKYFYRDAGVGRRVSIVDWVRHLHHYSQETLAGSPSYALHYTAHHVQQLITATVRVLDAIIKELHGMDGYSALVVHISPAVPRAHLTAAVETLHGRGVDPHTAAEEVVATILYSLELPDTRITTSKKAHGSNGSLYGVMNWSHRVATDGSRLLSDEQEALRGTIGLFLPLHVRVDTMLCRLPKERRVVYRGIRAHIDSLKYSTGFMVPWMALSSTSADFAKAKDFGFTLFIAHVHSASTIDFMTLFPDEAEFLLPSFTVMRAVGVTSSTLLRMIGSTCTIITVQAIGDSPTAAEAVDRLTNMQHLDDLYKPFLSKFVECDVGLGPPPMSPGEKTTPLFKALTEFLDAGPPHMLLLGAGGSGKTSAALAAHCRLSTVPQQVRGRPVVSIFIALPSVAELATKGATALDDSLRHHLGVGADLMDKLLDAACVVVFMESLDECDDDVKKVRALLDATTYCRRTRVIMSSRAEFLEGVSPLQSVLTATAADCAVRFVQPFSDSHVREFITRTLGTYDAAVEKELIALGLGDAELRTTPVTLMMAAEVVLFSRRTATAATPKYDDFGFLAGSRSALYMAYIMTMFTRTERGVIATGLTVDTRVVLDASTARQVLKA